MEVGTTKGALVRSTIDDLPLTNFLSFKSSETKIVNRQSSIVNPKLSEES